jgi:uncharacterized protein YbjQ (UPF0145 family)
MARDTTLRREPILRAAEPPLMPGAEPANRAAEPTLKAILVTTTPAVEGRPVAGYLGIVTGEVIATADLLTEAPVKRGFFARFKSAPKDEDGSLAEVRESALRDLKARAGARGADAVVGVSITQAVLGASLVVTATGTAVRLAVTNP